MITPHEQPLLGIDELLSLRPSTDEALARSIAKSEIQEHILRAAIRAGSEGLPADELADTLGEPRTKIQRITNSLRYEQTTGFPLIQKRTVNQIVLDTAAYEHAVTDMEQRTLRAETSLRALGDRALATTLELATMDDRSDSTTFRNKESVKLLLANAGLPVYFRHFIARYEERYTLGGERRDNNFYRRLQYMMRRPLFAHIITFNRGHNHSTYTIEPDDLDSAREQGLITIPLYAPKPPKRPRQPRPPKPKPIKPEPIGTVAEQLSQGRTVKPVASGHAAPKPIGPAVISLRLTDEETEASVHLLDKLDTSKVPFKVQGREEVLLDKIAQRYRAATGYTLLEQGEDGTIRMSRLARRASTLILP